MPGSAGPEGALLHRGRERSVQWDHVGGDVVEQPGGPADLAGAGQEREDITGGLVQRGSDRASDGGLHRHARARRHVSGLDGKLPPLAGDERCVAEQGGHRSAVQRRRHHEHSEIVAQDRPRLQRERQPQIGVDTPLVELVEDDEADSLERWIGQQHPGQYSFGHDLDPGARADPRVMPDPIADQATDPSPIISAM